jgi:AbrB family looped-hinge helix DNA binding protein
MTVVHMSEKGQIVVPKDIRDSRGFANGSAFSVLQTKSGALVFRPVKTKPKPRRRLSEYLSALEGIDTPARKHIAPPRP